MERLGPPVPVQEQSPLQRHIEDLKVQRESAPIYPQPVEIPQSRFTGPEVAGFAYQMGPFFDVLFPEYSLHAGHATGGRESDLVAYQRRLRNARKGRWEQAIDEVGDFIVGLGMIVLAIADDSNRGLQDVEVWRMH